MTADEVVRRLRALVKLETDARPISIDRLAQVAGVHDQTIYGIAASGSIAELSRKRLGRALEWVENDQVRVHKRPNKKSRVTIGEPRPPQMNRYRVRVDDNSPARLELESFNPRTFPHRKT